MADEIGYIQKNDAAAAEEVLLQSSDMYIRQAKVVGLVGTADLTVPAAAVLSVTPSPAWTADAFAGMVLVINGKEVEVDSNDADSITFDSTGLGLVDTDDYAFRVMGAAEWLGYSEGKKFTVQDDFAQFKDGIPRTLVREDLLERQVSASGSLKCYRFEIIKTLLNMKDASTLTHNIATGGSNPSSQPKFEFIFQTKLVSGKATQLRIFWGKIKLDGDQEQDSDTYKMLPYSISAFVDPIRTVAGSVTQDNDLFETKTEK